MDSYTVLACISFQYSSLEQQVWLYEENGCIYMSKPEYSIHSILFLIYALKNKTKKKLDNWNLIWLHVRIKYNLSSVRELTLLWNRTHWLLHADVHHYGLRDSKRTPSISLSSSITVGSSDCWLRRFWTAAPAAFQHRSSHSTDLCKRFRESSRKKSTSAVLWAFDKCDSYRNVRKVKLMAEAFHNAHRTSWKPAHV